MVTDPGKVPDSYNPKKVESDFRKSRESNRTSDDAANSSVSPPILEVKKSTGKPRWCSKCQVYKPPRSHHCPWIHNCVGYRNHGHFLRFLTSVSFAASYCLFLFSLRIMDLLHSQQSSSMDFIDFKTGQLNPNFYYTPPPSALEVVFTIINIFILFILLLSVGILYLWQMWYVSMNVTTIEKQENTKIDSLIRRGLVSKDYEFPYDLGIVRNFYSVLGSHPYVSLVFGWCWIWKPPGDGISFPVSESLASSGEIVIWPPPEYYTHKSPRYMEDDTSDEEVDQVEYEDDEVQDEDNDDGNGEETRLKMPRRHIRRGSEGYIVREWTPSEREAIAKYSRVRNYEDIDVENVGSSGRVDGDVDSEDDEVLGIRHRKLVESNAGVQNNEGLVSE
ncbi:Palmitoyltransferase [Nowakowskiella sp. JEL0407]|nr:Palmitoyltransferase [Nowakowskiella sp. JEL0407]